MTFTEQITVVGQFNARSEDSVIAKIKYPTNRSPKTTLTPPK